MPTLTQVAAFHEAMRELDPSIPLVLQPGNHDVGQNPSAGIVAEHLLWLYLLGLYLLGLYLLWLYSLQVTWPSTAHASATITSPSG